MIGIRIRWQQADGLLLRKEMTGSVKMSRNYTGIRIIIAIAVLLAALAVCTAAMAGATVININKATLNAVTRYWVNGTTTAVAYTDSWNAYFDAGTSTLTLRDAKVDQYQNLVGSVYGLIQADGDLTVVLAGSSSLTDTAGLLGIYDSLVGLYANGNLTVRGSGSLDFAYDGNASAYGVYSQNSLNWLSGTYRCSRSSGYICGMHSRADLLIAGGNITIEGIGQRARGISASSGHLRMMGGTVRCRMVSQGYDVFALHAGTVELAGGNGVFSATGSSESYGIRYIQGTAEITGGCFTFVGEESAMLCTDEALPPEEPASGMEIEVSENADGTGAWQWYTSADGLLGAIERYSPYTLTLSPFRYISFCALVVSTPTPAPALPQTGDGLRWPLWAGMVLWAGIGIAGLLAVRKRRKAG